MKLIFSNLSATAAFLRHRWRYGGTRLVTFLRCSKKVTIPGFCHLLSLTNVTCHFHWIASIRKTVIWLFIVNTRPVPARPPRFVGPTHGALNNVCDPTDNAAFYQEPIPQLFLELALVRWVVHERRRKSGRTAFVSAGLLCLPQ